MVYEFRRKILDYCGGALDWIRDRLGSGKLEGVVVDEREERRRKIRQNTDSFLGAVSDSRRSLRLRDSTSTVRTTC